MAEPKKLHIPAAFDRVTEYWSPHVAARLNGQEVRLAKIKGPFEWHRHDGVDEAFFVMRGRFSMRFREGAREWAIAMTEGDLLVVPAGAEHMPDADEECWIMLFETAGTRNTGEHESERTRKHLPELC